LKKRTKELLNPEPSLSGKVGARYPEVFCFFFSKKKFFLGRSGALFARIHAGFLGGQPRCRCCAADSQWRENTAT
jgi:hypothetical protein